MKLTKTDHHEQALVLDRETTPLLSGVLRLINSNAQYSSVIRSDAFELLKIIENPEKHDHPALFQRSHGNMMNCPDCAGSGCEKYVPDDLTEDVDYPPCPTCKGTGQLYLEVIRKGYVPTQLHRKKLAK